ncbi:transposase [Streptomyces sp. NPDC058642]|uniref:transposase n=1 Tax=Streptomyces sp. NPDC058642 TaxID=3346572 RepID=UPI0036699611
MEWDILRPLIPAVRPGGRPAKHTRREILNALVYWLRAGCAWRLLPHDLPPWQTVYHYWRRWQQEVPCRVARASPLTRVPRRPGSAGRTVSGGAVAHLVGDSAA